MESELVSGFMTEHASTVFVFFFLAEYASIVLMSVLTSVLFLGGYLPAFFSFENLKWIAFELDFKAIIYFDLNLMGVLEYIVENPLYLGLIHGFSLGLKTSVIVFCFIWVRASFPRIRYDQLMSISWLVILPILFSFIILIPCIIYSFDAAPLSISLLMSVPLLALTTNKKY